MGMIEAALLAQALTQGRLAKALHAGMLAERGELANARECARGLAAARSRWLSDHDAERSFPCGVVQPEGLIDATVRDRRVELAVIAAVLPSTVVFLVEPPPSYPGDEPIDAGGIDRRSGATVEVVGLDERPMPRPAAEPIDPEPEVAVMIHWPAADETRAEQRLLFRSSWDAWMAADRLRDALA
jgi:hypothetical protein